MLGIDHDRFVFNSQINIKSLSIYNNFNES